MHMANRDIPVIRKSVKPWPTKCRMKTLAVHLASSSENHLPLCPPSFQLFQSSSIKALAGGAGRTAGGSNWHLEGTQKTSPFCYGLFTRPVDYCRMLGGRAMCGCLMPTSKGSENIHHIELMKTPHIHRYFSLWSIGPLSTGPVNRSVHGPLGK